MARQRKLLPARRREAVDESVVIRSAETLGRMIGSLQRQLDGAAKRFAGSMDDGADGVDVRGNGHGGRRRNAEGTGTKTKNRARAAGVSAAVSGATKIQSTADRKSKRASKSARAKKSAKGNGAARIRR